MPGEAEAIARRWFELHNDGSPDDYGTSNFVSLYSEECDIRLPSPTTGALMPETRADLDRRHNVSATRFRDKSASLYELIADGPTALMRYVWQATTRDDAIDLPPRTVRRVDVAHFLEVRNGLIVSSHEYGHMENGNVAPPQSAGPDGESGDAAVTADRWVKAYNRASSFGDYISAFADNVDWWRMSTGRFPHGKAGGLADYREALEFDAAALSEQRMDPYLVIAAGPRAAMRYRWFAKAPTGDTVAWDRVAVITVSGERITRLHEYGGPLAAS